MNKFCQIKTTFKNKDEALALAKLLHEKKLIASAQIKEMYSMYSWKNEVQTHKEFELSCLTKSHFFKQIEAVIKENHSYELPEIISISIENTSNEFAHWIDENLL